MNDLVSRQAAYDALTEYYHHTTETQHKSLKEALNRVPTISTDMATLLAYESGKWAAKQKHGKWIDDAKTYYEQLNERGNMVDEYTPYFSDDIACSECLAKYSMLDNETQFFKFCPNCGAKMERSEE